MGFSPLLWGSYFWRFIHLCAYGQREKEISQEQLSEIRTFLSRLCLYLPCPGCQMHCNLYIRGHDVNDIQSGEDFWQFTVNFHNAVNKRYGKLEVTFEEAEDMLHQYFQDVYKTSVKEVLSNTLLFEWFLVLWCTLYMIKKNKKPEKDLLPAEIQSYQQFLCATIRVSPLTLEAQNVLIPFIQQPTEQKKFQIDTLIHAQESLVHLYNAVADLYDENPKTLQDFKEMEQKLFNGKVLLELTRADQVRLEDHKKIQQLQQELQKFHHHQPTHNHKGTNNYTNDDGYKTATIVLGVLLGVTVLLLFCIFYVYKVGWRGRQLSFVRTTRKRQTQVFDLH